MSISNEPLSALPIARILGRQNVTHLIRAGLFIGTLLLVWISLKPFTDLTDLSLEDVGSGNDAWVYIWFGFLAVTVPLLAWSDNARGIATLMTPAFVLLAVWMVISVLISQDLDISVRRFIITACVMMTAATMLLLPRSENEMARWLIGATLAVLGLCYFGILLMPGLSIHQATDIQEPHLAGDWRGVFGHKNGAAAMMVLFSFVGLYAARRGAVIAGVAITALAITFVIFSGGKSALGLLGLVLIISHLVPRVKSSWMRATLCLTPLVLINLFSVGTVMSDGLARIAQALPLDTTFTGRTEIWHFALDSLASRPFTGYGFSAFWGSNVMGQTDAGSEWALEASHSHNSYLDTALTMGVPGLALVIAAFVIGPLKAFQTILQRDNDSPLAHMFLRMWLFGIYLSSMESFFLDRADPIWFTFLLAIFGLHYLARFRVKSDAPTPSMAG